MSKSYKINRLKPQDIDNIKDDQTLFTNLVDENTNFVHSIISKYPDYDYPVLYQEGVISLWKAINKYDKDKRTKEGNPIAFSTFAHTVIKNDTLQILRKENKRRARETAIEKYVRQDEDTGGANNEYIEKHWKNNRAENTNFEDIQMDRLQRERMISDFSELEKEMFNMRVVEKRKVNNILEELSTSRSMSYHTMKGIYYKSFRPKVQKALEVEKV